MAIEESPYIWHNGRMKRWQDATVHVLAHALHYGSSVFEGIRVYDTPDGPRGFRLAEHVRRLFNSAKIYRIDIPYDEQRLVAACSAAVLGNNLTDAYVRPIAYRGYRSLSVAPAPDDPVEVAVAAWRWGAYLGEDAVKNGVDVCVSSWQRVAPNTVPAGAKAGGNYLSGQLVTMEAQRLGFAEGIALGTDGMVSEGGGENVFVVCDGVIHTPPVGASILAGLTRDAVIHLAQDLGYEVRLQALPRELLYTCDEAFFTGTAVEITPIRSVDHQPVGDGRRGPVTLALQDAFYGLFDGQTNDARSWLQPLDDSAAVAVR